MGIMIAVMVAFNGGLTERYGVYSATVMIHIVGLIMILAIVLIKRDKLFAKRHAWFLYLGGAIGIFTTMFNNMAFGRISVSAILALGLFGQSVAGIIVDKYGLWGMPKHAFSKHKLIGLALILIGIASMINSFEIMAVIVSFGAGVTIVLSRTLNGKLADLTNERIATCYNYIVGLVCSTIVLLIIGRGEIIHLDFVNSPLLSSWWIYLGGILGVGVVFISNVVVVRISAFYLSLFIFIGKIFSSIVIDVIITRELSIRILIGGVLVAAGLSLNLLLDRRKAKLQAKSN